MYSHGFNVTSISANSNVDVAQNVQFERPKLALIGASPLLQECLLPAFSKRLPFDVVALLTIDSLVRDDITCYDLILLFVPGKEPRRSLLAAKQLLDQMTQRPPFAVLADSEEIEEILAAFEFGARAYIPTSITFDIMIEAIRLVVAGGAYYPVCALSAFTHFEGVHHGSLHTLTPREMTVLQAICQGRPNKIIAQELKISESTIKVHAHRLMKKLKVRNRTQAAIYAALIHHNEVGHL